MRVLAVILALTLPTAVATAEEPAAAPANADPSKLADRCGTGNGLAQYRKDGGLRVQPLGAMPPAAEIRAVYRTVDGCPAPVVLRKGIGANPEKQLPLSGFAETTPLDR